MAFRISDLNIFQFSLRAVQKNRSQVVQLQNQLSSGRSLLSPADDPGAAARVLALRENLSRIDQFQRNIENARAQLDNQERVLSGLSGIMIRARELAVSADTETPEFDKIAVEVRELFGQTLELANTRVGDSYLFGGHVTDSAPITQTGAFSDPAPIVAYNGDSGVIAASIETSTQIDINLTAREVFLGSTDGDDVADGNFVNLFNLLQDLNNRLEDPATYGAPTGVLGDVDKAIDQINSLRARVGGRSNRLDAASNQLSSLSLASETERSTLEDTDLVEAITQLQQREQALEASLSVSARVVQPSLLDFLN